MRKRKKSIYETSEKILEQKRLKWDLWVCLANERLILNVVGNRNHHLNIFAYIWSRCLEASEHDEATSGINHLFIFFILFHLGPFLSLLLRVQRSRRGGLWLKMFTRIKEIHKKAPTASDFSLVLHFCWSKKASQHKEWSSVFLFTFFRASSLSLPTRQWSPTTLTYMTVAVFRFQTKRHTKYKKEKKVFKRIERNYNTK